MIIEISFLASVFVITSDKLIRFEGGLCHSLTSNHLIKKVGRP